MVNHVVMMMAEVSWSGETTELIFRQLVFPYRRAGEPWIYLARRQFVSGRQRIHKLHAHNPDPRDRWRTAVPADISGGGVGGSHRQEATVEMASCDPGCGLCRGFWPHVSERLSLRSCVVSSRSGPRGAILSVTPAI